MEDPVQEGDYHHRKLEYNKLGVVDRGELAGPVDQSPLCAV